MKTISILELNDKIDMEDWCRPLYRSADFDTYSDSWFETSQYSGAPLDHLKWTKVKTRFGDCWQGKTLKEYFQGNIINMEFARGDIPEDHKLIGVRNILDFS